LQLARNSDVHRLNYFPSDGPGLALTLGFDSKA
jgi:hypothetical protein